MFRTSAEAKGEGLDLVKHVYISHPAPINVLLSGTSFLVPRCYMLYVRVFIVSTNASSLVLFCNLKFGEIQSNFNGSNTFWTMKISLRQG